MLDIKFIRENPAIVQHACDVKRIDLSVEQLLDLDRTVVKQKQALQALQQEKNQVAASFPTAKAPEQRELLKSRGREIGARVTELQAELSEMEARFDELMFRVPNIPYSGAPVGPDASANVVVETHGSAPVFEFPVRDHVELLEMNAWADFAGAAKISGSRSYVLKNEMVILEQALILLALQRLVPEGFQPVTLPVLVREHTLFGTGHLPTGREDIYFLAKDDLYLSGTAEVGITSLHKDEILNEADLPQLYVGYSPSFRREAGSAGRDVRGLLRVHQFNKVEQYVICKNDPEESLRWHETLLGHAKTLLTELELPFQVIECATGDMGAGKVRMHDIETWIPSLGQYRETHSCSTLHDWQARRANLRYRNSDGKLDFVHTLNNTYVATPRILAPFVECHQQANGSVYLPPILRGYFNGRKHIGGTSDADSGMRA